MNKLPLLDDILYNGLRPWLAENGPDDRYMDLLAEIKVTDAALPMKYQLEYYRPFNAKTSYYRRLILNEMNRYCDWVIPFIGEDENIQVRKFLLNDTLDKKLLTRLKDIGKLIREMHFDIAYIHPSKTTFDLDTDHKTNTYIVHLLKFCLIKIYMEIEHVFQSLRQEVMEVDDFYTRLLFEPVSSGNFIKEIQSAIRIEPEIVKAKKAPTVRQVYHSFTYKKLNKETYKLKDLWDSLKKFQLIAQNTGLPVFKKVFSGEEVAQPVEWTGNASEFYYFIYLIYTKYQLVENLHQQQWQVACKCFVRENGVMFDPQKIKKLSAPQLTLQHIERAVGLLK